MSTSPKGITIHEGFNDLGSFEIDITNIEVTKQPQDTRSFVTAPPSNTLLFKLQFDSGEAIPQDYKGVFTVKGRVESEWVQEEAYPDPEGFIQINTPAYPVVIRKVESGLAEETVIKLDIQGPLDERAEEIYIEVSDNIGGSLFTLIWDLVINDGHLAVFDGVANYYPLSHNIDVPTNITAVHVTQNAVIYGYNSSTNIWDELGTMIFTMIEFPQNLTSFSDGFYQTSTSTGTLTQGTLGVDAFALYKAIVTNPDTYYVDVNLNVIAPGTVVYSHEFTNLMPSDPNYIPVNISGTAPARPDTSPTLGEIEVVSGVTFSVAFSDFLASRGIDTTDTARKAGPIKYIEGFPASEVGPEELNTLQSHVDLYSVNNDISQNQHLISTGFDKVYTIATTPKNVFLDAVVDTGLPLFQAAQIHEVVSQNQKLVANLLAGTLTDLKLANPTTPNVPGSNWITTSLANAVNTCGCDDCKSNISPFAYLMDLIKYSAAHVDHTVIPLYQHGGVLTDFITLISNKFLQPFGTLNVDCSTLHDEYCRVRLVTEVLEKLVTIKTTAGQIPAIQLAALTTERNQFLTLVYRTILTQAGTSIEEIRDIFTTQPLDAKTKAAQKLADRLGIPLYVPSTSIYTVDRMWLTFGNPDPLQVLNAPNIEEIFGFRDTKRNVLTLTPVSLMEQWHAAYLREDWKKQDYLFSNFSREGVIPGNPSSYKANWLPIIDPDNMGWEDMTYLNESTVEMSIFTKSLWQRRKEDTDQFLKYCVTDSANISRTSADINNRILKVTNRDIVTHVLEDDKIQIEDSLTNWISFTVINRKLVQTDTDVILAKSTPALSQPDMFQPLGASPTMKYNRVLSVSSLTLPIAPSTPFTLSWTNPVFADQTGYVKLKSVNGATITEYATDGPTGSKISSVSFNPNNEEITLELDFTLTTFPGNIYLVYEVEVPLYTTEILDPNNIAPVLFFVPPNIYFEYNLLPTAPFSTPFYYQVWNIPSGWSTDWYGKLKELYQLLLADLATDAQLAIISDDLHMNTAAFNRMMQLMGLCESYLLSMYTAKRPTTEELYELASYFRASGRTQLRDVWVREEIEHLDGSSNPFKLMISSQFFWRALTEPKEGTWDPSLQTLDNGIPIIDPELLNKQDMLTNPEAKPFRDLYDQRISDLELKRTEFLGYLIPFDVTGFIKIFNNVYDGSLGTTPAYTSAIFPYTTLEDIENDLTSQDAFKQKEATDILWAVFKIPASDFSEIMKVKAPYDLNDPQALPSNADIKNAVNLLTSAFKRSRLYPTFSIPFPGWISQETNFYGPGSSLKYYNVIKMRMGLGRSDAQVRIDWHSTLDAWNRQPFIQPDLVPPENIKNFVPSNWIYSKWNLRRIDLLNAASTLNTAFTPSPYTVGNLLTRLEEQLNLVIARVSTFTPLTGLTYLPYFTQITEIENNGDDIRPNLDQLGITVTEYRELSKIYKLLQDLPSASTPPLLDSEKSDLVDIIISIRSRNLPFAQVLEEYNNNIILDQDYFQIYKPAPINFPLTDLPVYNQWRSPYADRKAWVDTLETRIEREQAVTDKWTEVLQKAEDRNMPFMRDALIRALTGPCELWTDVAERLARTYFIETKDNCCFKHTRVSFAIETLQGFLFALQNGIYDDFIADFTLVAPNFEQEWNWIGSYGTWRSAVFVFIYPENLLYPTLKRLQSPKFIDLANKLQSANRFSPENACSEAKVFQDYLRDLENLEIICSSSSRTYYSGKDPNNCCDTGNTLKWETYFFAQGKSGTPYWSIKENDIQDGYGFWEPLPIETKDIKLLGCYVLGKRDLINWSPIELSLYLFYTYMDNGKLKMSYIKKNLFEPDSLWSAQIDCEDLPKLEDLEPAFVTACQQNIDADVPCFILSYGKQGNTPIKYTIHHNWGDEVIDIPGEPYSNVHIPMVYSYGDDKYYSFHTRVFNKMKKPVVAIRHDINSIKEAGVTMGFPDDYNQNSILACLNIGYLGKEETKQWFPTIDPLLFPFYEFVGAFQSMYEPDTLVIHYRDFSYTYRVIKVKINGTELKNYDPNVALYANLQVGYPTAVTTNIPSNLAKIYPIFHEYSAPRIYAFKEMSSRLIGANILDASTTANYFALAPEKICDVNIESSDCVKDMNQRTIDIKTKLRKNMNQPQGSSPGWIFRPASIKELLYEAYYFVPMLLALDQQKRGQYPVALTWYRSIYDYTNSYEDKRKIFYGLKLEETNVNSFVQAPDWLLDPLNPHLIAQTRTNAYTKYTLMNIIQCIFSYADREFTLDTIETVPIARKLYSTALDLLKVKELDLKINLCSSVSSSCLDTQTNMSAAKSWTNNYSKLKQDLNNIGDATVIESLITPIAALLNAATEETFPAKFADAFQMIDTSTPAPPASQNVTEVVVGFATRVNEAYSYLSAINSPSEFNVKVAQNFASTVAGISGLSISDVAAPESAAKISWLTNPVPDNKTPYQFDFATPTGQQFLTGDLAYNPLNPAPLSYPANLVYGNATVYVHHYQNQMPPHYTPLIDYKFCTAQNPVYNSLQLKGNVELYKIFNCRNIAGMVRELDVFAAATDSTTGIPIIGASGNLSLPGVSNFAPSQYRFRVLIDRAKQIAAQAQQMESLFLAALEKEDAENYNQLRARQDLETAKATVKLQDLRITQANDEKGVANIQLGKATFMQTHYNYLIANGLNAYEISSLVLLEAAVVIEGIAVTNYIADVWKDGFDAIAKSFGAISQTLSLQSSVLTQLASFQRRSEEWQFQSQLAGYDISLANQQIKVADDNVRIVSQERQIAQLNVDHSQDSLEFLKTKFTNAELYNFMGNVLERSYSYMLNLSTAVARTAESQLYFERQEQAGPFILDDYWETPSSGFTAGASGTAVDRRGLTGSARLLVDITRLDQYAFETVKRKLQLTKVISVAQNYPSEFQQFKETGVLNFELTNKMFDYDFPGNYLRLVNSVKTTVVGLLPVYDSIKATLTADTISYTVIGGTTFQKIPIRRMELDSVGLTSSNNATGLFELQPTQSELLNPFEAMGIESRWEFKMPQFSNRMDFDNIADILFTVEYTALDNSQYRYQVLQDLDNKTTFNRGFSFKNNFPDQWYELGEVQSGPPVFSVNFDLKREFFPQGINNLKLNGDIKVYFVREDGFTDEIKDVDIRLASLPSNDPGSETINGLLPTNALMNSIQNSNPLQSLQLIFKNNFTNRGLFIDGKVKDILLLVGCKAELKSYPL